MSAKPKPFSEKAARELLARYECPTPYHAVRARFLGAIATPLPTVAPMAVLRQLWGGELPEFDSLDAVNELIGVLVNGLWNDLAKHQKRTAPFRLTHIAPARTREGLLSFARLRREEAEGFIDGLFGGEDEVDFPESASAALEQVRKACALMAATEDLAADPSKPTESDEMSKTIELLRLLSRILENEINAVVLACVKNRRAQMRVPFEPGSGSVH